MSFTEFFLGFFQDLPTHLQTLVQLYGVWLYLIIFLIIFVETGLVVMPFLPGDSLLFALGALCGLADTQLNVFWMAGLLTIAAIMGDTLNYWIGAKFGGRLTKTRWVKPEYMKRTNDFFATHGGKTIILARFMPFARTYAPFVAGIGKMSYSRFIFYNVVGGVLWINLFLMAGFWFGNQPIIKRNFHVVILAIIVLSVMPAVIEFVRIRRKANLSGDKL